MTIELVGRGLALNGLLDVFDEIVDLEVSDSAGLRRRSVGGIADGEDVLVLRVLQGVLVDGDEILVVGKSAAGKKACAMCGGTSTRRSKGSARPS